MKIDKQTFINKWSVWWMFNRQAKGLTEVFEKGLDELISDKGGEITKEELLKRGFLIDTWVDEGEHIEYYYPFPDRHDQRIVITLVEKINVCIENDDGFIQVPNCKTLSQLDALIEMFKTN